MYKFEFENKIANALKEQDYNKITKLMTQNTEELAKDSMTQNGEKVCTYTQYQLRENIKNSIVNAEKLIEESHIKTDAQRKELTEQLLTEIIKEVQTNNNGLTVHTFLREDKEDFLKTIYVFVDEEFINSLTEAQKELIKKGLEGKLQDMEDLTEEEMDKVREVDPNLDAYLVGESCKYPYIKEAVQKVLGPHNPIQDTKVFK